ncbi:MAG: hypothetical protein AAF560_20550 [Acidobacteriota bacterium]
MKLAAPKQITFIISLVLVLLGILVTLGVIPALPVTPFWLAAGGYVLLALGVMLRDL